VDAGRYELVRAGIDGAMRESAQIRRRELRIVWVVAIQRAVMRMQCRHQEVRVLFAFSDALINLSLVFSIHRVLVAK